MSEAIRKDKLKCYKGFNNCKQAIFEGKNSDFWSVKGLVATINMAALRCPCLAMAWLSLLFIKTLCNCNLLIHFYS
jgi:hypothetical protein